MVRDGRFLVLLLQLSETFQAPPALRDIRNGPVELLGQRFVRVLGPVVRFQAAKLLVIFLCPCARYLRGSSWIASIRVSTSRGFRKGFMGPRKEILELALECEVLDVLEAPGSASSRRK